MHKPKFSNLARTTTTLTTLIGATTATVASTAAFPSTGYSLLVMRPAAVPVDDLTAAQVEIVMASWAGKTGTTIPITRAQDGTTAKEWPAGSIIDLVLTSATIGGLLDLIYHHTTYSLPGLLIHNDWNITGIGDGAISIYSGAATGARSIALGQWTNNLEARTIQFGHPFVADRAYAPYGAAHTDSWRIASTPVMRIAGDAVDLTAIGTTTISLPNATTEMLFLPIAAGLLVTAADTVTVQPQVSFGITGSNASLLAAIATTAAAVGSQDYYMTLLHNNSIQNAFTMEVTVAATATTLHAQPYLMGYFIRQGEHPS